MTETISRDAPSLTSTAPIEPNISTSHAFTDIIHVNFGSETKTFSDTIEALVGDELKGCGRVDLVALNCKCIATKAGQSIKIGFCENGASVSINQVALKQNGLFHVANAYTVGVEIVRSLTPEDTLSLQIRPVSAFLPTTKLMVEKSDGAVLNIEVQLVVRGMRTKYVDLK